MERIIITTLDHQLKKEAIKNIMEKILPGCEFHSQPTYHVCDGKESYIHRFTGIWENVSDEQERIIRGKAARLSEIQTQKGLTGWDVYPIPSQSAV